MNTCEDVQESISRYVDGDLPASGEPAIFAHAAACSGCRTFLRSSMEIRAGLRADTPPAVPDRLDRRILGVRGRPNKATTLEVLRGWWVTRLPLPLPAVAGVVVIILFMSAFLFREITAVPPASRTAQAEYILTLEPVEVRGEPVVVRQNGEQF